MAITFDPPEPDEVTGFKGACGMARPLAEQADKEDVICPQSRLTDTDADAICAIIEKNKVKKLVLMRNDLGDEAAVKIAAAVAKNTSLTFLSLGWNKFTEKAADAFAEAIVENETLTNFFFDHNKMTPEVDARLWAANAKRKVPMKQVRPQLACRQPPCLLASPVPRTRRACSLPRARCGRT